MVYKDYKGKPLIENDDYFILPSDYGFYAVHCEEVEQHLIDIGYDFYTDDYDKLLEHIYITFGINPEKYIGDGEFK